MNYPRYNNCNDNFGECSCDCNCTCDKECEEEKCISSCDVCNNYYIENDHCKEKKCEIFSSKDNYINCLRNTNNMYSMSWPENPRLARAYVHFQNIDKMYCPEEGLRRGTIFPELLN